MIDDDYGNLANLINALARDAHGAAGADPLRRAKDVLSRSVDGDFAREGTLFRAFDDPDADIDARQHRVMAHKVDAVADDVAGDPISRDMDAFLDVLGDWPNGPIVGTDTTYGPYSIDRDD